jgi:hypothetical protein
MTQKEVETFLQTCTGRELSEIMRRVLSVRPEGEDEGTAFQHRLVLSVASRENFAESATSVEWGPWELAAVAYEQAGIYPNDFQGEAFVQYGDCETCKLTLCSHAKQARCPLCDREVFLT